MIKCVEDIAFEKFGQKTFSPLINENAKCDNSVGSDGILDLVAFMRRKRTISDSIFNDLRCTQSLEGTRINIISPIIRALTQGADATT